MTTDDAIRASDGDREHVAAILRDAYATGRLTLPEFDERAGAAFTARTWGELRALTADLPDQPKLAAPPAAEAAGLAVPDGADAGRPGAAPAAGQAGAGRPGRRSAGRLIPALPIAFFWIAISLFARGPEAYLPIIILLLIGLKFAGSHRPDEGADPRRPGTSRDQDHGPGDGPGSGG